MSGRNKWVFDSANQSTSFNGLKYYYTFTETLSIHPEYSTHTTVESISGARSWSGGVRYVSTIHHSTSTITKHLQLQAWRTLQS